jgi:hypothetical protein
MGNGLASEAGHTRIMKNHSFKDKAIRHSYNADFMIFKALFKGDSLNKVHVVVLFTDNPC